MKIIKNDNFKAYRNCRERSEKIKYIVIHYTGAEGTAADNIKYFNNGNRSASAHYFVDRSGEIREYCDPSKWYAWHCGGSLESSHHPYYGKCTNGNSIGIEICTHFNGKTWEFTEKAVKAAEELAKELMKKFTVSKENIIRHYDVTGKACPRVPGWGAVGGSAEFDEFRKALGAAEELPATVEKKYYRVRKSWEDAASQIGAYLILDNAIAEANNSGPKYAVYDWDGKEIYRYSEASGSRNKEIRFYYPGYKKTNSGDYQSHGAGCVWHDEYNNCIIVDAYWKDSEAAKKLVAYLEENHIFAFDILGTHAHGDHLGEFFAMADNKKFSIENAYFYDPESLKLAGTGSQNAKSVKSDKEYLQKLIDKLEAKGTKIHYVKTGDVITCGEIRFEVFREQPEKFGEYDTGEAWGYLNDGSINLFERACRVHLCGDGGGKKAAQYFNGETAVVESEHHGNGDGASKVAEVKKRGCGLAIECNYEKNGPGSCSWTKYGANRFKEAGIPVWQLDADITGVAKDGKLTVKQGSKTKTFDIPFGKIFYRVRKTWANAASQIGAFAVLAKAKECADAHPGYNVYDETGKQIYPETSSAGSAPAAQTKQEKFIEKIGALAKEDNAKTGICGAVTVAQAILESGWGESELATRANNLYGMKKSLSGNTWPGSTWDGKTVYSKRTKEVYSSGTTTVKAEFRVYKSIEDSVKDHGAYLSGAKNGSKLRFAGIVGCADYKKAAQIIKSGEYATETDYVDKICKLVEQYDLTRYNGTYKAPAATKLPYLVKVKKATKIYKTAAGADSGKTCPIGIFTIVEEKSGYGRLKSGAGWIKLDSNTVKQ